MKKDVLPPFIVRSGYLMTVILPLYFALCLVVQANEEEWTPLFDGETLTNWVSLNNYGAGEVAVADGAIQLPTGTMATGIRYDNKDMPFPTSNYEIRFTAERRSGSDFFAAITFPVGSSYCTLINGGWGGTLVGLSSINGMDASENSTSSFHDFKNKVKYRFKVAVTNDSILAWIDDEPVVLLRTAGSNVSTRFEMERCKPLGFAGWVCHGAIYSIEYRLLSTDEIAQMDADAKKNDYRRR